MVTTGDSGTVTSTMLASNVYTAPGTIGSGTPNTGAFTTLSASSTVSGTGFSTYLASPPAIGGTAAAAGTFTTLSGTTSVTTPIVKSASSLTLQSNGTTTAVTIDTSQNFMVNTTTPQSTSAGRGNITLGGSSSAIFNLSIAGANSGSIYHSGTEMWMLNSANGPNLFFTNGSERMRIDSSGNVLINSTSTFNSGKTNIAFDSASNVGITMKQTNANNSGTFLNFAQSGTTIGTISGNATNIQYNTSSDYRLKENIVPMTGALAKVALLKPVTYKWKIDGSDGEGFIAHELAEVCSHAVNGAKDAVDEDGNPKYQGIDVSFLVATLTAALQETKALIDTQAATINALTARIVALEARA
jgi:hypothetical protein